MSSSFNFLSLLHPCFSVLPCSLPPPTSFFFLSSSFVLSCSLLFSSSCFFSSFSSFPAYIPLSVLPFTASPPLPPPPPNPSLIFPLFFILFLLPRPLLSSISIPLCASSSYSSFSPFSSSLLGQGARGDHYKRSSGLVHSSPNITPPVALSPNMRRPR